MKLEKLVINNINSFVGVKEIDFIKLENELFLITGATGSGKTTIFDAICAVLYNKTPRLGNNPKELLNNISDKGYIKLDFSVGNDKFEANWEVKRKKDKTIGNIKRTLYKNEKQIADKTTEFDKEISKILNLGFEQFTKSIILAQGEFDAFLKAKDDEKIKVLEKILPIKEYELISKKIFTKKREIETSIMNIDKLLDEIKYKDKEILTESIQKEKTLKKDVEKLQIELKKVEEKIKQVTLKKQLLSENQQLKKDLTDLDKQNYNLKKENLILKKEFENIKKKRDESEKNLSNYLNELDRAIELRQLLENIKKEKDSKINNKENLQKEINNSNKLIKKYKEQIENLNKNLNSLNVKYNKQFEVIQELIPLKVKYNTLQQEQINLTNQLDEKSKKKENLTEKREHLIKNISQKKEKAEYLEAKVKVLKYENDRKELKSNEPCPLCGSLIHPYKTNPPKVSEAQKEYEEIQKRLKKDEEELKLVENEINVIEQVNKEYIKNLNINKNKIDEIEKVFKNKNIKINEFDELKKQKEEYDSKLEEKMKIETEKRVLETKIESNQNIINEKSIQLENLENEIEKLELKFKKEQQKAFLLKKELVTKVGDFKDIYDKKNELLTKNKEINELYNKKLKTLTEIENSIKTNNSLKEEKEKKLAKNSEELSKITIDDKDYELLKSELNEKIITLSETLGKISEVIINIKNDLNKFENLSVEKKVLNQELKLYTKLNDLVGSSDGKKFKKIAINFMMKELIFIANIHLDKLSNYRYVFEIDENIDKLDLFVIDKFNENQKRGVATLSGGESFLASLALSFGLSDMIRQTVQIYTLFLDEGFGSLDNDSLSNALNILKDASSGKMIGIISHVDSLKEEIPRQIQVIKKVNGQSDLKII
jgi:exonuclease SbcC